MQSKRDRQTVKNKDLEDINMFPTPACTSANSKVGKLIRELRKNVTRKNIVLLLVEIAERPETSIDFDITLGSYLNMFLQCQGDVVMSEAGHLILSAAKIYSRRVDNIYESMQKIVSGMEKSIKEVEVGRKTSAPKQKRALKRPRTEQDPLYEAELTRKNIKIAPLTKTTEVLSSLNTFEAPKNCFRDWGKYKEWRAQHKKKMKCPVPYSTLHDNIPLHPSLWKLSGIEDFDYEDDIDTKRNYRVFTNYIEHRHSTLVEDINFTMHFKVKDFIEAEEDEIEIMNILGLPPPPKRKWPPICKNVQTRERNQDYCSVASSEDYIKNYLQLENALLENENCESNNQVQQKVSDELYEKYQKLVGGKDNNRNTNEANCNVEVVSAHDVEIQVNLISEKHLGSTCNNNVIQDHNVDVNDTTSNEQRQNAHESTTAPLEHNEIEKNLNQIKTTSSQRSEIQNMETVDLNLTTVQVTGEKQITTERSNSIECNDTGFVTSENIGDTIVNIACHSIAMEENISKPVTNKTTDINASVQNNVTTVAVPPNNEITAEGRNSPTCISNTINETASLPKNNYLQTKDKFLNDNNNIIIRLSYDDCDEGIALSELHEVDLAMLRPSVSLVDILKPIMNEVASPTDLVLTAEEPFSNFLAINETHLNFQEDFRLPLNVITKTKIISKNVIKIPENILRKTSLFNLPKDFNIFKTDRRKRKSVDTHVVKRIKLYKLNDSISSDVILTPPHSPSTSDFLGFNELPNLCENDVNIVGINSVHNQKDMIVPKASRSFSRDSGIGISSTETSHNTATDISSDNIADSFLNVSNLNQSQLTQNTSQDSFILNNPDLHSTAIQDSSCPLLTGDLGHTLESSLNCTTNTSSSSQAKHSSAEQIVSTSQNVEASGSELLEDTLSYCNELHSSNTISNASNIIEKVQKWHRHLKPILQQSKDRHHFDVFAMGTEIIDKISENETGKEVITFDEVMRQKDPSYISRYFLSTLLLANQNNISLEVLNANKDEPVPLNKIQLTLKSKQRHTISIEDDIGASVSKRSRTYSSDLESQSPSPQKEFIADSSREVIEQGLPLFERNNEKIVETLKRYREANREMLIKEIGEHRDDYIRILSRKHSIDLGLYFTDDEIQRVNSENSERNFENECLIYPKNLNTSKNKTKNVDDADSGFHSHNTRGAESANIL